MIEKLMHKYALSKQGASDMIKAIISATISNIILMVPVALLYYLVRDYMAGNLGDKVLFYVAGCLIAFVLIGISTYIQYNATFLSTYVESGVRRVTLAEKLRKIPLSFFGKKDLADLYFYRTTRSILMFGQLFCWLGVLPLNRIFYFAC